MELPMKDEYSEFIRMLIFDSGKETEENGK
jgi:hypothetical protein